MYIDNTYTTSEARCSQMTLLTQRLMDGQTDGWLGFYGISGMQIGAWNSLQFISKTIGAYKRNYWLYH